MLQRAVLESFLSDGPDFRVLRKRHFCDPLRSPRTERLDLGSIAYGTWNNCSINRGAMSAEMDR